MKILILITVLSVLIVACKPSPEQLFNAYFEPYNASGTYRSEDRSSIDNDIILALVRYDEGQYGEAALSFTKTIEKKPNNAIAIFLRGVSYLAIDSLDLAEVDLRAVVDDKESMFVDQGKWYLSLVYLGKGDEDRAHLILKELEELQTLKDLERVKTLMQQIEK